MARSEFTVIKKANIDKIDENIINHFLSLAQQICENKVKNIELSDSDKIKIIASKFLNEALQIQEEIRSIEKLMYAQKTLRKKIREQLQVTGKWIKEWETNEYRENREKLYQKLHDDKIEKFYYAAETFIEEINNMLSQTMKTVILLENANGVPELFEVSKEQMFQSKILSFEESSKSSRLVARFKVSSNQLKKNGLLALQRDNFVNDNLNLNNLNITYQKVIWRFDTYERVVTWFYPNVWNRMKVSARGDISEAYAYFFFSKHEYDFKIADEYSVDIFMEKGVGSVDAISGLLRGDISDVDNNIEYSIKSADASFMGIPQLITLANNIMTKGTYDIQTLKGYKNQLETPKNKQKIRNPIERGIKEPLNMMLDQLNNT